jgi:sirohydrochlorin ferrochelatase
MKDAVLVIAHGSREKESNDAFLEFMEKFRKTCPQKYVQAAFQELSKPDIPAAVDACVAQGAESIIVVPFMLFPGRHVKKDIPEFIQKAKLKYPQLDFHYTGPLADHPAMVEVLLQKAGDRKGKHV